MTFMNKILQNFFPVADMLAETFGSCCEVVVHDLTHPQNSVIYVANNKVTGRTPGQSFEHLIKQVLLNSKFDNDRVSNYIFEFDKKKIKSSSSLIRDENDVVIGMLCINIDLTMFYQAFAMLTEFLPDVNEDVIPYKKSIKEEDIEEERRMFYVAVTRAKKYLHVFSTEKLYNKESRESRFLTEIRKEDKTGEGYV